MRRGWISVPGAGGRACVVLLALVTVGCSQAAVDPLSPPGPPVVWPKPPDTARVRFLGQLTGSDDFVARKSFSQQWNEWMFGPAPATLFVTPYAVAVHPDGNRVAVADTSGACVHVMQLDERRYSCLTTCTSTDDLFECPVGVAWVADDLWISDSKRQAIAVMGADGSGRWIGRGILQRPAGLAYCVGNDLCYVADAGANAVVAFERSGESVLQFGSQGSSPGQFNRPSHVACGSNGTLIVADSLNFRVQILGLDGTPGGAFGRKGDAAGDLSLPKGVAVDADGNVWVVDAHFENVQAFTPDGRLLLAIGQEGSEVGEFWLPAGIFIDNRRRLWVADSSNHRVQVFELLPS